MKEEMEKVFDDVEVVGGIAFNSSKDARDAYAAVYKLNHGTPIDLELPGEEELIHANFIGWLNGQAEIDPDKDTQEEIISKTIDNIEAMANINEAIVEVYLKENDYIPSLAKVSVAMIVSSVADPSTFRHLSVTETNEHTRKVIVRKTQQLMADFFEHLRSSKEDMQ